MFWNVIMFMISFKIWTYISCINKNYCFWTFWVFKMLKIFPKTYIHIYNYIFYLKSVLLLYNNLICKWHELSLRKSINYYHLSLIGILCVTQLEWYEPRELLNICNHFMNKLSVKTELVFTVNLLTSSDVKQTFFIKMCIIRWCIFI